MMNKIRLNPLLISFFFLIVYLLLPSTNSSIDSWAYALFIKEAKDLFLPHHLLNGAMGFIWVKFVGLFIKVDVLRLMLVLNALFAAAILYLLGLTLKNLGVETKRSAIWVAFVGSTWAIMRYATENEVYIFPIFFSLLGTYFFVRAQKSQKLKDFLMSGAFAALACLFHQIMFFWWLAILVGVITNIDFKKFLGYSLPALIVPIVYLLAIVFYYDKPCTLDSIMHFVFNDYYSGAAGISSGLGSLLLLFVGLFRSFFQVHGYFINLNNLSPLFYLGIVFSILMLALSIAQIRKVLVRFKKFGNTYIWVHALAIIFQLFFAFLSSGNAEFMVMIPVLIAIVFSQVFENDQKLITYLAASMFIWNVSLGLIPLRVYNLDNNKDIAMRVVEETGCSEKPLYILFNKPRVENEVEYQLGYSPKNLISGIKYDDINSIKAKIDSSLSKGAAVYTDCLNRPQTISRETLTVSNGFENQFKDYNFQKRDSINTLTGTYYLYIMSRK